MKQHVSVGGALAFGNNVKAYMDSGTLIAREETAIRERREGEHKVGNGHFLKIEKLRSAQRQALIKILEGFVIIAVGVGAVVAGIYSLDGCGGSESQDEVSSVQDTISLRFNEEGLK